MKKIKIVALVDEPFINTYETLFYEAKKSTQFEFIFVCIKSADERMGAGTNYKIVCDMLKNKKNSLC